MKIKQLTCALLLTFGLAANAANQVNTVYQVTEEVTVSENVDYIIAHTTPFVGEGKVNITNTDHAVVIFQSIRPSHVLNQKILDGHVFINGEQAVNGVNCQVRMYAHGSIVFPYAKDIKPLTVYSAQNYGGTAVNDFGLEHSGGFMNTLSEAKLNNQIRSFKLKRGYMVTFATGKNGWGYSRCFIADKEDLEVDTLPAVFDCRISSYRVFQWHDVQKKGLASDTGFGYNEMLGTTYCYDWATGVNHLPDRECVPHQIYVAWPSVSACGSVNFSCHMQTNNEPGNSADDTPQSVEVILNQWQDLMRTGLRLCSESSHDGSWSHLDEFITEVDKRGWRCDILDLHCYWASGFGNMEYYYNKYGNRPIWITEYVWGASWNNNGIFATDRSFSEENQQKNLNEMKNILTTLNNSPYVERYAYWNGEADCSKLIKDGVMSLTGEYYRDMNSGMAYRKKYEKVPNVVYTIPTDFTGKWLSQTLGTYSLNWKDTNFDMLDKILVLRKKGGNSKFDTIQTIKPTDQNSKYKYYSYIDTLTETGSYTYRIINVTADGNTRASTNTVTVDKSNIKGTSTIQYGELSLVDTNPMTIQFTETMNSNPAVFMGLVSNNNSKLYPGNLITSVKTSSFTYQAFPWVTSETTEFTKKETIPYMAMERGNYRFDQLDCEIATANVNMTDTTTVVFSQPFPEGVTPVILTETRNQKDYPISIKVCNVSNTGFKCILMCEEEVGKKSSQLIQVFYLAISPGVGTIDKDNGILIAAGRGATPLSGSTFGDANTFLVGQDTIYSISPYIFANLQTANYDAATMVRQHMTSKKGGYTIGGRFKRIVDPSRKKDTNGKVLNQNAAKDEMGWVIIYEYNEGVSVSTMIEQVEANGVYKPLRPYLVNGAIQVDGVEEFEVYSTQGTKMDSKSILHSGVYIVKAGPSSAMILVK